MKKLLYIISGLLVTVFPTSNLISCKTEPKIDPDYYIPELNEQPKSIEEIEKLACEAYDKNQEYLNIKLENWLKYRDNIKNWDNLKEDEKDEHKINFFSNSIETQKSEIFQFWWFGTYQYKIYQFNPKYKKELITPLGYKLNLEANNKERYANNLNGSLNYRYSTVHTKQHIQKIYNWGIQDNPNANNKK
ncbi:hypothetical protein [Spiroplasma floricola]|uniref:Uncharacterized protein n=1 Tax=Spiroplasma floricola 23-6 TaxID=1336749 RepID=A0A2K8SDW5_9MOLU|nr:hypothetical protein [Spiroplasma floricola]AUB31613.1 hypothetical protein SFLOR_v1c05610 [Spiroplasma floricola 23-6]